MDILPILSALRRNRVGAILIGIQIALTLAIVCNSLSIIQDRLAKMQRSTGIDEQNIFTMANSWVGRPTDVGDKVTQDLAVLRSIPGVVDATSMNSFPLRGGGWSQGVELQQNQKTPTARTSVYFTDDHSLAALGMRLVAGRWFTADEVGTWLINDVKVPSQMVVTQAMAKNLFPDGNAVGKNIYLTDNGNSTQIIGIVDRTQTPWTAESFGEGFEENSIFLPYKFAYDGSYYVVRSKPGMQASVMHAAEQRLLDVEHDRVIQKVRPFSESRALAYRSYRALSLILGTVCALLLIVTACGIVGLTTYWVGQRRRQVGVRRALGARKIDILRYFQTENLLIAGAGAALGICLAVGGNLWLVTHMDMTRISIGYVLAAAAIVLVLSQAAVIWPAARAAAIPPAMATRNV
jgi:putative ABC transport system permease protein